MSAISECITVPAPGKHTATMIFVHGLGDSGYGLLQTAEECSRDPRLSHVKWVLPHAPVKSLTANRGQRMPSWYDIHAFETIDDPSTHDADGMFSSRTALTSLISADIESNVPASRVVLGGFSQGATMSLLTGLTMIDTKLGGIAALSGRLPLQDRLHSMVNAHATELPIFWAHGEADPLVRFEYAINSINFMKSKLGVKEVDTSTLPTDGKPVGLSFHSYRRMEHTIWDRELEDLRDWLAVVIPPEAQDDSDVDPQ